MMCQHIEICSNSTWIGTQTHHLFNEPSARVCREGAFYPGLGNDRTVVECPIGSHMA